MKNLPQADLRNIPREHLNCRQGESPQDVLSVRQIGEIRGLQWGREPGALVQLQGKRACRLPHWLRRILDHDFGGQFPSEWRWVDHWGKSGETFITEPYGLDDSDTQQIVEFCRGYGLQFHIGAESQHFPTRTLCVQIWQR